MPRLKSYGILTARGVFLCRIHGEIYDRQGVVLPVLRNAHH